jgi:hypothetical protein
MNINLSSKFLKEFKENYQLARNRLQVYQFTWMHFVPGVSQNMMPTEPLTELWSTGTKCI